MSVEKIVQPTAFLSLLCKTTPKQRTWVFVLRFFNVLGLPQ